MVSENRADVLRDPTTELKEFYTKNSSSSNFPAEVTRHFSSMFSAEKAFKEIPTLDVETPPEDYPDRSVVRFRAMVQDTSPSAEMYLCKTNTGGLGGWGIHEESDVENTLDYADLRECTVFWAVSVPGESRWCSDELNGQHSEHSSASRHQPARPYKYPQPAVAHIGVQVKIYDIGIAEKLKSTDLATFVGILTQEPFGADTDFPSEVPTLHVLFILPPEETLLTRPYPQATTGNTDIAQIREDLILWIANEALDGDRDTAEWALLVCIAKVISRSPPLLPPSLTISHFPSPPVPSTNSSDNHTASSIIIPAMSHVLSQLLPLFKTAPLSLGMLNKVPFAPESKDEDLHSGVLQLPRGSVLLVTEGNVREGRLFQRGLTNIGILQEVIAAQSLAYVFPFSQFSFPTDISCIILSEGKKSAFFKTDISVPFQPTSSSADAISRLYKPAENISMPLPSKLAAFRDLVIGARLGKVHVSQTTSEYIQQTFVRDRQQNPSVTSEDLIRRMTVAKLYALSLHAAELTVDIWERAKAFDDRRIARAV